MNFVDAPPKPETPLDRAARLGFKALGDFDTGECSLRWDNTQQNFNNRNELHTFLDGFELAKRRMVRWI